MRIQGEIVHQRLYTNNYNQKKYLLFLKVDEGVMVNGIMIHTIPVICSKSTINYGLGERVNIEGKIKFQRIITPSGNPCSSPIPVVVPGDSRF